MPTQDGEQSRETSMQKGSIKTMYFPIVFLDILDIFMKFIHLA